MKCCKEPSTVPGTWKLLSKRRSLLHALNPHSLTAQPRRGALSLAQPYLRPRHGAKTGTEPLGSEAAGKVRRQRSVLPPTPDMANLAHPLNQTTVSTHGTAGPWDTKTNKASALKEPEVERQKRTHNHNSMASLVASVNPNFKESALLSPPTSLIWSLEKKKNP